MAFKFDKDKDVVLKKFPKKEWGLTRILITAHSYNGGEPKIGIVRQRRKSEDTDEWNFVKLGRLDYEEAKFISQMLRKHVGSWYEDYFHKHGTGGTKGGRKKKKKDK